MSSNALGRVLDPAALDACEGDRARLSIDVPAAWLDDGADLVLTSPARLACARCDGGGCDPCGRSGALRAPSDAGMRVILASVAPGAHGGARGFTLRITRPFGPEHPIAQLLLEVRVAERASACVTRTPRALPMPGHDPRVRGRAMERLRGLVHKAGWRAVAIVIAAVATLLFTLLDR